MVAAGIVAQHFQDFLTSTPIDMDVFERRYSALELLHESLPDNGFFPVKFCLKPEAFTLDSLLEDGAEGAFPVPDVKNQLDLVLFRVNYITKNNPLFHPPTPGEVASAFRVSLNTAKRILANGVLPSSIEQFLGDDFGSHLYKSSEACANFNIDQGTLSRLIASGDVPACNIGSVRNLWRLPQRAWDFLAMACDWDNVYSVNGFARAIRSSPFIAKRVIEAEPELVTRFRWRSAVRYHASPSAIGEILNTISIGTAVDLSSSEWVDSSEVIAKYSISRSTLAKWRDNGLACTNLHPYIGRPSYAYSVSDIEGFVKKNILFAGGRLRLIPRPKRISILMHYLNAVDSDCYSEKEALGYAVRLSHSPHWIVNAVVGNHKDDEIIASARRRLDVVRQAGIEESVMDQVSASLEDGLRHYISQIAMTPPLSEAEESGLIREAQAGSEDALHKLVEHNLRLVVGVARGIHREFKKHGIEMIDLIQEGNISLYSAVDGYDDRGRDFAPYVRKVAYNQMMKNVVRRHFARPLSWKDKRLLSRVQSAEERYFREYGFNPNHAEVARIIGVREQQLKRLFLKMTPHLSIDSLLPDGEHAYTFEDTREDVYDAEHMAVLHKRLVEAIDSVCTYREKRVVCMRFGIDEDRSYAPAEVAEYYGVSKALVEKAQASAIQKLQNPDVDRKYRLSRLFLDLQ